MSLTDSNSKKIYSNVNNRKVKVAKIDKKTTLLNGGIDLNTKNRIQNLEDKAEEQSNKLDKITSMLHAISEKTSAS